MTQFKLKWKPRRTRRATHEMVLLYIKHGNHYHDFQVRTDADVKRLLAAGGMDFDLEVDRCRNPMERIPFQNLVGTTVHTLGKATIAIANPSTGEEYDRVEAPGTISMHGYWAQFEVAVEALNRAVEKVSTAELLSAITQGIAAIETYLNYRAELWNRRHSNDALIDSRSKKVSFNEKIDVWIPKMTGGKKLRKGLSQNWPHFRELRQIRDDENIHAKKSSQSASYGRLADLVNIFRSGIAGLLIDLHLLFGEKIPAVIVLARYAPDMEVVEDKEVG